MSKKETYRDIYEKHFGPIKKGSIVHHLNGQHSDNRLENLILISKGIHCWLHRLCKWIPKADLVRICRGIIEMCEVYDGKTSK